MEDLHKVGGIPAVIKMLLAEGMLNGDWHELSRERLVRENVKDLPPADARSADRDASFQTHQVDRTYSDS